MKRRVHALAKFAVLAVLPIISLLPVGCDRGFGLTVNVIPDCLPQKALISIAVSYQPSTIPMPMTQSFEVDDFANQPRIVVVPPEGATAIHVDLSVTSDGVMVAHATVDVPVNEHTDVTMPVLLASCPDGGVDLAVGDLARPDLAGEDLAGADLSTPSADLSGTDLASADLASADLASADLAGADLSVPDLAGVDFSSSPDLVVVDLSSLDLAAADLTTPDLSMPDLTMQDLRNVDLTMPDMAQPDLAAPLDMSGCNNNNTCPNYVDGNATCVNGVCQNVCNMGFADCNKVFIDGCEVKLNTDPNNCGACGHVCNLANCTAACVAGTCQVGTCNPGFSDCDKIAANGCEAQSSNNVNDCGGCGVACSSNHIPFLMCSAGMCTGLCAPGYADCNNNKLLDGCEVDYFTDDTNCGSCGHACPLNASCVNGLCTGGGEMDGPPGGDMSSPPPPLDGGVGCPVIAKPCQTGVDPFHLTPWIVCGPVGMTTYLYAQQGTVDIAQACSCIGCVGATFISTGVNPVCGNVNGCNGEGTMGGAGFDNCVIFGMEIDCPGPGVLWSCNCPNHQ